MFFKKNKKGDEDIGGGGFSVIIVIIIFLASLGIIIGVIKNVVSKSDEKLQVDTCRISNAIKFGLKEKTQGFVSIERACTTIDKTKEKMQVPTKDYPQNKEGAESEIREMIKNCWYEWLDGSKFNMFDKNPFTKACFVCYTFKIKPDINGVTFSSLEKSMNEPFFAADASDNCAGNGGFLRETCQEDDEKETKLTGEFKGATLKCCIKKDPMNECGNKGGKCSSDSDGAPKDYPSIYTKWSCPNNENCYIKEDSEFSYLRYIREYSPKGGDIMFISPQEGSKDVKDVKDIAYEPGKIYAISFVSPSEQFCATSEEGKDLGCYVKIGGYAIGAIALGVGAGYAIAAVGPAAAGSFLLGISGKGAAASWGFFAADATVGAVTGTSITSWVTDNVRRLVVGHISVEVPNFIIVSTVEHALELGCTTDYGG